MRSWKLNDDKTVKKVYGSFEKPYPDGIIDETLVDPKFYNMSAEGLMHDNGVIRFMTYGEIEQLHVKREAVRQASKKKDIKDIENNFIKLCQALFGTTDKRTFGELGVAIETLKLTNFPAAVELGLKLSAVNQEGLREIGTKWWDDCIWHPENV